MGVVGLQQQCVVNTSMNLWDSTNISAINRSIDPYSIEMIGKGSGYVD